MKKIALALLCTLSMNAGAACLFSHERISGLNKVCTYNCPSGQKSITVSSTTLCPLQLYSAMRELMGFCE